LNSFWDLFNPKELIIYGGKFLLLTVIFLENGVFFGFFLPGDSLLFTAGLLCYYGVLDMELMPLIMWIAASAMGGYYAGYFFGLKTGDTLYNKPDTLFFKKKYITTAEDFYKKYGGLALVMGRFLPIVRTFAPILAGIVRVKPIIFFGYNLLGAILWPSVIVTAGFYVGKIFPNALHYLDFIVIGFILVTSLPIINNWRKDKKKKKEENSSYL
jgi:membrane-associated protein